MGENNNCGNCGRGQKPMAADNGHCQKCYDATPGNSYPGWQPKQV